MTTPGREVRVRAEVLSFWFEELESSQWCAAKREVDDAIRRRFDRVMRRAVDGELYPWRTTAEGRLAEIIVLDQFSRCVHKNTPRAFAQDPMALVLAQEAVARGALTSLTPTQRAFLLMPYMHSESSRIHVVAEALFREFAAPRNHAHELRHKAIIDRFGRYPHRNQALGRASTPDESAFLTRLAPPSQGPCDGLACACACA
jgi:uncharacterized protein (DUF924 family)